MAASRYITITTAALVLFFPGLFCQPVIAESFDQELQGWGFFIEQDLFYLIDSDKNEDRDYTIGLNLGIYGDKAAVTPLYDGLLAVDSFLGLEEKRNNYNKQRIMNMGVAVFTPDDLSNPDPIYDDRPYASLVYLSNEITSIAENRKSAVFSEFSIGLLGLRIAEEVQTLIHKLQRGISGRDTPVDPQGWQNQISDGGELTFKYGVEYKQLLTQSSWYDLSYATSANIGYFTDLNASLLLRTGKRVSHFASYDYGTPQGGYTNMNNIKQDNFVFFNYQIKGVVYNELLQGGFRGSEVTFSSDQIERLVHYFSVGWSMTTDGGTRFTLAQYMHTPEFKGPNSRSHYWGGFYLTFPFAE